jgi:hypothetical protein
MLWANMTWERREFIAFVIAILISGWIELSDSLVKEHDADLKDVLHL